MKILAIDHRRDIEAARNELLANAQLFLIIRHPKRNVMDDADSDLSKAGVR